MPVLASEVVNYLRPRRSESLLIDATVGQGGHSLLFLDSFPLLHVVGVDADPRMLEHAGKRLESYADRVELVHSWYDEFLVGYDRQTPPDRILFDLGISMVHLVSGDRGFSYRDEAALDMRLNPEEERTALDAIRELPQEELANVIYTYGEERLSRRIAAALKRERVETAAEAAGAIKGAVPPKYRYGRLHPATRTFQALRIWVNRELERLERALPAAVSLLAQGGVVGVISFHSLEDRMVKRFFRKLSTSPEEAPTSFDGKEYRLELLTKKPVTPGDAETAENPASRSAKFRVARKVEAPGGSR